MYFPFLARFCENPGGVIFFPKGACKLWITTQLDIWVFFCVFWIHLSRNSSHLQDHSKQKGSGFPICMPLLDSARAVLLDNQSCCMLLLEPGALRCSCSQCRKFQSSWKSSPELLRGVSISHVYCKFALYDLWKCQSYSHPGIFKAFFFQFLRHLRGLGVGSFMAF